MIMYVPIQYMDSLRLVSVNCYTPTHADLTCYKGQTPFRRIHAVLDHCHCVLMIRSGGIHCRSLQVLQEARWNETMKLKQLG